MKTEDFIKTLAEDRRTPQPLWRPAAMAAAIGAVSALVLLFGFFGVRPDIAAALGTWRFGLKLVLTGAATIFMAWEFARLMRPQASPRLWPLALLAAAIAIAVAVELTLVPAEAWAATAKGRNWFACLKTIPFLSAIPLIAAIWAMREGAPARPALAGAVAGGVAAALGGFLYATHCTDDSPLFVAIWYPLAAAFVVAAGAIAGRLALRW
jgi:hypothetical protein